MNPMKLGPAIVLGFFALMNLARGGVHAFSPDGGAGTIAGLDLTTSAATIIPLFALIGVNQIVIGLFEAYLHMHNQLPLDPDFLGNPVTAVLFGMLGGFYLTFALHLIRCRRNTKAVPRPIDIFDIK